MLHVVAVVVEVVVVAVEAIVNMNSNNKLNRGENATRGGKT